MISTDDEARGIDYPYRGAPGVPLPAARIPAYGLFLGLTILLIILTVVLSPTSVATIFGVIASPVAAVLVTRRVMPHVSYWTPFKYWRKVLWQELHTPRDLPINTPERVITLDPSIFK
jgi:hypothetical protein